MPSIATDLFQYAFMQNALLAGTMVAICAGVLGYFVNLRRLAFAGHALAHVGFTGATGAVVLGFSVLDGMMAITVLTALAMGILGEKIRGHDVAIGTILAFVMGLGAFFLSLSSQLAGEAANILFGDILAISTQDVTRIVVTGLVTIAVLAVIARPLLFASIDPQVAAIRGVPVQTLGVVFMVLLGIAVAQAVQVVGVLLIFSLLVTPAAAAQQISARPAVVVALSVLFAVIPVWTGLIIAYYQPYPPSFFITTISFVIYLAVRLLVPGVGSPRRRSARELSADPS